jgi:hypothetical protein
LPPTEGVGRLPGAGISPEIRKGTSMPGKRVQFDDETWNVLDLLARDRMQDFQELADEAFRDLLEKHGRPTDLKTALRQSVQRNQKPKLIEKRLPPPSTRSGAKGFAKQRARNRRKD